MARKRSPTCRSACSFHRTSDPFRQDIRKVAEHLVEVVAQHLPAVGTWTKIKRDWNRPTNIPDAVHPVSVVRLASYDRSYWSAPDATFASTLSVDLIQNTLSRKNGKFHIYSASSRITWLLIVLDSFRLSGVFDLENTDVLTHTYESLFNRAIVYDAFSTRVLELKTLPPSTNVAV